MDRRASLYVMQAPDGSIKLGQSVNPEQRRRAIGKAIELVHATDMLDDVNRIERLAHR